MQETESLFGDDLLLEQDQDDEAVHASLPGTLLGGVAEAERALGVEGISAKARASRGFFAVLRTLENGRKQQKIYHLGQLTEVAQAVEATRTADIYLGSATYASARSRLATNVRALQVAWVDIDCYTLGLAPTPELLERLVERARFAGVPAPTHIVCSGRGLYLKWLLDAPVSDSDLKPWGMLQAGLSALYRDIGADFSAIDSARVLRMVGSRNSKVDQAAAAGRRADPDMVGVVWDSAARHRFEDLCVAVAQLDLNIAAPKRERAKTNHHAALLGTSDLPAELRGNLQFLDAFGRDLNPNLDLEAKARSEGKNGMSAVTLGWHRFLDLRDLFQKRAQARGATGIEEGSRDLAMLWMVNFLAQARMVRSSNVLREVDMLLPAFAGVGVSGPRGFETPGTSGALDTLVAKMKASEAGKRVRFAGGLWDPKYTPSNDYLINLFGITSDEMKGLRTIIDSGEKRSRADSKVPGRAQRREVRQTWHTAALRMRTDLSKPAPGVDAPPVPPRKLNAHIAQELEVHPEKLRRFFKTHDAAAALAEARKRGEAPPRMRRKVGRPGVRNDQSAHPLPPAGRLPEVPEENTQDKQGGASPAGIPPCDIESPAIRALRRRGYAGPDDPSAVQAWIASLRRAAIEAGGAEDDLTYEETREAKSREVYEGALARISQRLQATRAGQASKEAATKPCFSGSSRTCLAPEEFHRKKVIPRENEKTTWTSMPTTIENHESLGIVREKPKASKRDLLNRARKAQMKDPLLESAVTRSEGDMAQGELHATGQVEGPQEKAVSPAPTASIALNVIPAEMAAWSSGAEAPRDMDIPDDAVPAGMPELDDGYLYSLAPEDTTHGGGTSPQQVEQSSGAVSQAARDKQTIKSAMPKAFAAPSTSQRQQPSGKVLSFARATTHGPGAAPPSFGAKAAPARLPQASTPSGFGMSSGATTPVRPAAAPGGAIGFGFKPARLSSEQARVNGQASDFAKLFEDSGFDERGVPVGYPKPAAWPHDDLPAGSNYRSDEWAAARLADPSMPHGHIVVEVQVGNPIRCALLQIPRVAPKEYDLGQSAGGVLKVVNGKVVQATPTGGMEDLVADALADTIIVSRKSPVDPRWRGAVEGGIEQLRGGVSSYFRIIRPRVHFADPEKALYINAKLQVNGSFGEAGARAVEPEPTSTCRPADAQEQFGNAVQTEDEEQESTVAPKG